MNNAVTVAALLATGDPGADDIVARIVRMKVDQRVAIIVPARDEERTVGPIVAEIVEHLMERQRLADQLIVVNDGSIDATAEVARDV